MRARRCLAALAAGTVVVLALAGCPVEPSSSGAHGTVVKRHDGWIKTNHVYYLTVREDGGHTSKGRVTKAVYRACSVGERWPDCKTLNIKNLGLSSSGISRVRVTLGIVENSNRRSQR
jgi:hypothetical protein